MEDWPFSVEIPIRWRDLDALGHVNNAVYLSFLEIARVRLWHERMDGKDARDIPFVVARIEIDYRRSMELGQHAMVHLRCQAIGRSSFTLEYRITADGRLAAEARSVQVCIGPRGGPVPVAGPMRHALETIGPRG